MINITIKQRLDLQATKRAINKQVYKDASGKYFVGLPNGRLRELLDSEGVIYEESPLTKEIEKVERVINNKPQTVEVNICDVGMRSGSFLIINDDIVQGAALVSQAAGVYTGKGTLTDESEMDILRVCGIVVRSKVLKVYWNSQYKVKGNFKFNYKID